MAIRDVALSVRVPEGELGGILHVTPDTQALVVFAHGSGSSRFSPRNLQVARFLQQRGLGTYLFDLLTEEEEAEDAFTHAFRFDVPKLAARLMATTDFLQQHARTSALKLGYFGSSTGAAAALIAASQRPHAVDAVVSRGGRPDLARSHLASVRCPTLFLVGALDGDVLRLHREVMPLLRAESELRVVPHATHLFEEPGALEHVCQAAADWFSERLVERQPEATR